MKRALVDPLDLAFHHERERIGILGDDLHDGMRSFDDARRRWRFAAKHDAKPVLREIDLRYSHDLLQECFAGGR